MASETSEALAEDRKRSKYERLHECFWDKRAVQCVVRQMLDERDDLSCIDPVSANRMEYFANQLIGAASDDGKSFGNAAAMREALEHIAAIPMPPPNELAQSIAVEMREVAIAALAKPPRNCDIYTTEDAVDTATVTVRDCSACPRIDMEAPCVFCMVRWLLAPAKKGGAK